MDTPRKSTRGYRQTRREFAAAWVALGCGSAWASTPSSGMRRIESLRFRSREDLDNAATQLRAQFPSAVLLDAIAAPHVPELLVIHGVPLGRECVYEVLWRGRGPRVRETHGRLELERCHGTARIYEHRSLSERAEQWGAANPVDTPGEVGFYRVI